MRSDSFRFSIQFNLKREDHRQALEILNKIKKGDKSEFCISCILGKTDENQELKNLIENTIQSCLKDISIINSNTTNTLLKPDENYDDNDVEIMDGVLDFMNGL